MSKAQNFVPPTVSSAMQIVKIFISDDLRVDDELMREFTGQQ